MELKSVQKITKELIKAVGLTSMIAMMTSSLPAQGATIAGTWVEKALDAVEVNPKTTGPTVAGRIYGLLGTVMYDAWSAYEQVPISTTLGDSLQRPPEENTQANKEEAISFAAYRVLAELFPNDTDREVFRTLMINQGYDPDNLTQDPSTPAGIGNLVAEALMTSRRLDGSNQLGGYQDTTGYAPVNSPEGPLVDITRWTPEHIPIDDPTAPLQKFLTPHWGKVTPFALKRSAQFRPPAPAPFLLDPLATADLANQTITRSDGTVVSITPALIGIDINPEFVEQAEELVVINENLTDEQKAIAEFWEDGGGTYFPPGHWLEFGLEVAQRDNHTLDEDIQMFFPLGNAVLDVGIATWEAKAYYDYTRPVRAIRELARLGLIDPSAIDFTTYQLPGGNPSPPFAEYTSGHSAYSAAGAEILKLFTGSDFFGEGVTITDSRFYPGSFAGPVDLFWPTFSDAAAQAGMSRQYGGIHFEQGNIEGRILGREVGGVVWERSQFFIQGGPSVPEPSFLKVWLIITLGWLGKRLRGVS